MEELKGESFLRRRLKSFIPYYAGACILFLTVLAGVILLHGYMASLDTTLEKLCERKASAARVRADIKRVQGFLNEARGVISVNQADDSSLRFIYSGLDEVKACLGQGQMTVSNVEDKGDEYVMPLTLTGPIRDYQTFVAGLSKLQTMRFPFFTIANVTLTQGAGAENDSPISYEVKGVLSTSKPNDQGAPGAVN